MIAVTGATGKLGYKVALRLAGIGVKHRLIVRDTARAPELPHADIAQVSSYGDAGGMEKALTGVKTLFLVSARDRMGATQNAAIMGLPPPTYDRVRQQITAV